MQEAIRVFDSYTHFGLEGKPIPLNKGNINDTYLVVSHFGKEYILQRINDSIFSDIPSLTENHLRVQEHLSDAEFSLQIPKILPNNSGDYFTEKGGFYWRLIQFCEGESGYVPKSIKHYSGKAAKAFQTACAFGLFDAMLLDIPRHEINETIPNFHNTPHRWTKFEAALQEDRYNRATAIESEIKALYTWKPCFEAVFALIEAKKLPIQIIHNDAKVDNVVFAKGSINPIAVIDWDTIMSGCVLADIGDLVRSMAPNFDENHKEIADLEIDFSTIEAIYDGFASGFIHSGKKKNIESVQQYFELAAPWIIGEQALRFLTDYLQGDTYYKTTYEEQNLIRAKNQIRLLELLAKN